MKRRTLLKGVAGSAAIGFAGCLSQDGDAGGRNGTDSSNTDKTDNGATDTDSANTDGSSEENTNNNTDGGTTDNKTTETETDSGDGTTDGDTETNGGGNGSGADRTSTPSSNQEPALIDSSFEIVSSGCDVNNKGINVSFNDHTVRVTGCIRGKNSCYTAELQKTTVEQGTLTLTVRSFETESSGMCAMCLKNIEYESTHTFEGGLPKRAVVIHNGKQVLNAKRYDR
jgi:hypothetical protein